MFVVRCLDRARRSRQEKWGKRTNALLRALRVFVVSLFRFRGLRQGAKAPGCFLTEARRAPGKHPFRGGDRGGGIVTQGGAALTLGYGVYQDKPGAVCVVRRASSVLCLVPIRAYSVSIRGLEICISSITPNL